MPSSLLSLIPAVLAFVAQVTATPQSCPASSPLSCQSSTAATCCFNSPGGQLLLTQFWDTEPVTGPVDSWTIHGLWPDKCDGTFEDTCDPSRAYTGIGASLSAAGETTLLNYMKTYWKDYSGNDETFWQHEWSKHGTCINTLEPSCYTNYKAREELIDFLQVTTDLFRSRDSYKILAAAGITPSSSRTYSAASIKSALAAGHGSAVTIGCSGSSLNEIWYHYNVRGSVATGLFVPAAPDGTKDTCSGNISYKPKTSGGSNGGDDGGPDPPSNGAPFSGKGYISSSTGCLISAGTWYSTGTCATYTATASGSGFTLSSSKGRCGVTSGKFECSSSAPATVFTTVGGKLAYTGKATWYSAATPSGSTQQSVYTTSASGRQLAVTFGWESV